MGRPLNKKFFGDGTGLLEATAAYLPGAGSAVACHILRQRSNLRYEVANEATVASTALVIGAKYIIVTVSGADYTTVGAADNNVGTRFTATGTSAGGTGTAREFAVCQLQAAAPAADFEMRISVQAENAVTPVEAQIDFGTTGGVVDSVTLVDGGYGYWANGTFNITVASDGGYVAGTEAVISYTVSNGAIATVAVQSGGSGYTADLPNTTDVNTADIPDEAANPPLEYARIINARQVKTFEGNTYAWPTNAPLGGTRYVFTEADIDTQA